MSRLIILGVLLSLVLAAGVVGCQPPVPSAPSTDGRLLFLHGLGGWSGIYIKQTDYYKDADALSMPGRPGGTLIKSPAEALTWLHNSIQHKGYQRPVLIGHSFGGGLAMAYDLQYPGKLKGLVVAAGSTRVGLGDPATFQQRASDMEAYAKSLRDSFKRLPAEQREQLVKKMIDMGPEVRLADWICASTFDISSTVGNIKTPTLVIRGTEDNPERAESLAKQIPGSQLVLVKGAGHYLMLDTSEEFNQAIETFVKSLK